MSKESENPNQRQNGSDFDEIHFSSVENAQFGNLLFRLRSFESAVCRQFRSLEQQKSNNGQMVAQTARSTQLEELEKQVNELTSTEEADIFRINEKLIELEERIGSVKEEIKKKENDTKMRIDILAKAVSNRIGVLKGRIELLELKESENGENWFENGHAEEHDRLPVDEMESGRENGEDVESANGENGGNPNSECEIMTFDPFLASTGPLPNYDGNPNMSFSRWCNRFEDILSLCSQLSESQKLSRLRVSLSGQARAELDLMNPAPNTLQGAVEYLKGKFENSNTRSIAKQALSICRMVPGERVYEFSSRLNEAVRTAYAGASEEAIKEKLLEEFLEKLNPELQFEVKAQTPETYTKAYEIAQHFELLIATRKASQSSQIAIADSAEKMEALAIRPKDEQTNKRDGRRERIGKCYYCLKPGHYIRDCNIKKGENSFGEPNSDRHRRNSGQERRRDPWKNRWNRDYSRESRGVYSRENRGYGRRDYSRENRGPRKNTTWKTRDYHPREDRSYTPENWRERRSPTTRYPKYRRGYGNSRSPQRMGYGNSRSPQANVRFERGARGKYTSARTASPLLLALLAILALFGPATAKDLKKGPLICLKEATSTIWNLPEGVPTCPSWEAREKPISYMLSICWPNCIYQAGHCQCPRQTIIWKLDKTHLSPYVFAADWKSEYTHNIWAADSGDFALTFNNGTREKHWDKKSPAQRCLSRKNRTKSDKIKRIPLKESDPKIVSNPEIDHNGTQNEQYDGDAQVQDEVGVSQSRKVASGDLAWVKRAPNDKWMPNETKEQIWERMWTVRIVMSRKCGPSQFGPNQTLQFGVHEALPNEAEIRHANCK